MTPLRQRMIDAMTVRGMAQRTQECYTEAIARMARHHHRSPELLSPPEIEAYLLHLVKDRKLSFSTVNQAASACRFLFETVLQRKDQGLRPPMARVPQKQPHLLSRQEIAHLFSCCGHPAYRMALQTIYASGLRVSEVAALRVADIDSAPDRMCVRVNAGKGSADRYSLLSQSLLALLRRHCQTYAPQRTPGGWLFARWDDDRDQPRRGQDGHHGGCRGAQHFADSERDDRVCRALQGGLRRTNRAWRFACEKAG